MSYESFLNFMLDYNRNIHTIKPAVVTSVNHNKNVLSAKILTKTLFKDGTTQEFQQVYDVPYFILSGKKGSARITLPVSSGDNVLILFSDRDVGELLSTRGDTPTTPTELKTHSFEPIMALPCFFTTPNAKSVPSDSVVIENQGATITLSSSGDVVVTANTVSITAPQVELNGTVTHTGSYILNGVPIETHGHIEQGDGQRVGPPIP